MNLAFCRISSISSSTASRFRYRLQNQSRACLAHVPILQLCLTLFKNEFVVISTKLSTVVACRCSPTQKVDVARIIRNFTKKRVCCIDDGGNDVSMIQAADVKQDVGFRGEHTRTRARYRL